MILRPRETVGQQNFSTKKKNLLQQTMGGAVNCDICNEKVRHRYSLIKHKNLKHGMNLHFDCEKCGKKFSSFMKINMHIRLMHAANPCKIYGKAVAKSAYQDNLNYHQTKPSTVLESLEPVTCDICKFRAENKFCLVHHINCNHLDVVVEILPICCEMCNKECTTYANFLMHLKNVHGPKLKCDYCDKMFPRYLMAQHIEWHQSGRDITRRSNRHEIKGRTFSKNLQCTECGTKYAQPEMLAWHTENCHGNNPTVRIVEQSSNLHKYQCIFCKTAYYSLLDVITHLKRKHQLRKLPYHCKICHKQFVRNRFLPKHILKCKKIFTNDESSKHVNDSNKLIENHEQLIEEVITSDFEIENHEDKLELEGGPMDCFSRNVQTDLM
ncbi:hypothetical protein B566_EDAN001060 [Ephemera danica]|nr:hypothetical protein B566_EDAN001060 [Ephemera danica]